MLGPIPVIVCVDCGGLAHLTTPPPEDDRWAVGDVVTYRCSDCGDRWDLVLEADDLDGGRGTDGTLHHGE